MDIVEVRRRLLEAGWTCDRANLYPGEEDIDGYRWEHPDGREESVYEDDDGGPEVTDAMRAEVDAVFAAEMAERTKNIGKMAAAMERLMSDR